jgi:iron complex outermembrane recepter protein
MERNRFKRRVLTGALGPMVSMLAIASPAWATETSPTTPAQDLAETLQTADEIVVTATRRSQSVRDVPFNIQAISADVLEKMGATDIADFAHTVPGLSISDACAHDDRLC